MAFDEYQFVRYLTPGSLAVGYILLLAFPCFSDSAISYLIANPDFSLALVGAAFGISLAVGYLIYALYTVTGYDRDSLTHVDKTINGYLKTKITNWDEIDNCKRKEFLDFLYYWKSNPSDDYLYSKVHSIWTQYVGRNVSAFYVPGFSGIVFTVIYLVDSLGTKLVFSFPPPKLQWFGLAILAIILVSVLFYLHTRSTRKEAWTLEYFILRDKISKNEIEFNEIKDLLLTEPCQQKDALKNNVPNKGTK